MATYTTRTVRKRIREYVIPAGEPWGADYGEVAKAASAARAEYRLLRGLSASAPLADDVLRFYPKDDEIVIRFVIEERES